MAYWLFKTEPGSYSYFDLEKDKKVIWDGVKNPLALKYLRQAKKGDLAIIYHSGKEKAAIGVAKIASDPFPDPKLNDARLVVVEAIPQHRLKMKVALKEIKSRKDMAGFLLVKIPRLSVVPVTHKQWEFLVPSNPLEQ